MCPLSMTHDRAPAYSNKITEPWTLNEFQAIVQELFFRVSRLSRPDQATLDCKRDLSRQTAIHTVTSRCG